MKTTLTLLAATLFCVTAIGQPSKPMEPFAVPVKMVEPTALIGTSVSPPNDGVFEVKDETKVHALKGCRLSAKSWVDVDSMRVRFLVNDISCKDGRRATSKDGFGHVVGSDGYIGVRVVNSQGLFKLKDSSDINGNFVLFTKPYSLMAK